MKFTQQTKFEHTAIEMQEADLRDYATYDRLAAFNMQQDKIK